LIDEPGDPGFKVTSGSAAIFAWRIGGLVQLKNGRAPLKRMSSRSTHVGTNTGTPPFETMRLFAFGV